VGVFDLPSNCGNFIHADSAFAGMGQALSAELEDDTAVKRSGFFLRIVFGHRIDSLWISGEK
jgi:hypothetical protein